MYNGSKQLLEVLVDVNGTLTYLPVALLSQNAWQEDSTFLSTTTRLNGGWATSFPTMQSFSVTFSAVVKNTDFQNQDQVQVSLFDFTVFKNERTLLDFRIVTNGGEVTRIFKGYIKSLSDAAPVGKFIRFTGVIVGDGAPVLNVVPVPETIDENNEYAYDLTIQF